MPFVNISTITDKLMGFSCLEGELHKMLTEAWSARFSLRTALLATVAAGEAEQKIRAKVVDQMEAQSFQILPGDTCGFAVFLDLTKELVPENLNQVEEAISRLESALGCSKQIVSYFGYAGKASLLDQQLVKANINLIQNCTNRKHKLWLVATALRKTDRKNCWKPSVIFLDLLRRSSKISARFSSNAAYIDGTVGCFRYREYDNDMLNKLQQEEKQVKKWLDNGGSSEFKKALSSALNQLEEDVKKRFAVDASLQPIHPDMYPKGYFKTREAKRNVGDFAIARQATEAAINTTVKNLEQQITEYYANEIGNYKNFLIKLFEKADVSIGFVTQKDSVKSILNDLITVEHSRVIEQLTYNKDGYLGPIQRHLSWALEHSVKVAKKKTAEGLLAAYASFSEAKIQEEHSRLADELSRIGADLQHVPDKSDFVESVLGTGTGMSRDFTTVIAADGDATEKFLLCRKQADMQWIENGPANFVLDVEQVFIDEQFGGVARRDDADIKGLYAMYFACTEARLDNLLS